MADDFEYWAFISYSHSDERAIAKLHRLLETYRVPPAIAAIHNLQRGRIFPIFRDREETSASSDLKSLVMEALDRSRYLVVVCSKASFNSRWVNAEVQAFIDMGRADRIICCILDDPSSIPRALQKSEPLAADITKDGWNGAKLKIVSAILSCKFDDLKQRDLQRSNRRMAVIATAAFTGVLLASGLAAYAFLAKYEANLQRELASFHQSKAEELVSFMLGDLRESLEPIGRLDVLDAVGDEVLGYFSSQPTGSADTAMVVKQASALRQVGEIRVQQGRLAEGLEAFTSAMVVLEDALPRSVNQEELLFEIGQLNFWIADAHLRKFEYEQAELRATKYLETSLELQLLDPENPDYRMEVAWGYNNLGTLAHKRGNLDRASSFFSQTLDIQRSLVEDFPDELDYLSELAHTTSWAAAMESARGSLGNALDLYRQELALHESVAAQVEDTRQLIMQARAQGWIAATLSAMGRYGEAMRPNLDAQSFFRIVVAHDPDNVEWAMEYYWHQHQFARYQIWIQQLDEAIESLQVVREVLGDEPATDAGADNLRLHAALSTGFAYVRLLQGHIPQARAEATHALSLLQPHVRDAGDNRFLIIYGEAAYLLSEATRSPDTALQALKILEAHVGGPPELQFRKFALAVNAQDKRVATHYRNILMDSEFVAPLVPESSVEEWWHSLASSGER
jgi:tetratricopeptide (TPR) repeat protein